MAGCPMGSRSGANQGNDAAYLASVNRWIWKSASSSMASFGKMASGHRHPLENEYSAGTRAGEEHILSQGTRAKNGLDVRSTSSLDGNNAVVSAWRGASTLGGYPSAPWMAHN